MNATEFRRRVKKLAKANGVQFRWEPRRGKGSHGTMFYGNKKTTVKHGEIGEDLLRRMLRQLGLTKKEFSK